MKKAKTLLAIMLSIAITFTFMPSIAFAAGEGEDVTVTFKVDEEQGFMETEEGEYEVLYSMTKTCSRGGNLYDISPTVYSNSHAGFVGWALENDPEGAILDKDYTITEDVILVAVLGTVKEGETMELGQKYEVSGKRGDVYTFTFTPSEDGRYRINSLDIEEGDPFIKLDWEDAYYYGFAENYELDAGETYTFVTGSRFDSESDDFSYSVKIIKCAEYTVTYKATEDGYMWHNYGDPNVQLMTGTVYEGELLYNNYPSTNSYSDAVLLGWALEEDPDTILDEDYIITGDITVVTVWGKVTDRGPIELDTAYHVDLERGEIVNFTFLPSESGYYKFYSYDVEEGTPFGGFRGMPYYSEGFSNTRYLDADETYVLLAGADKYQDSVICNVMLTKLPDDMELEASIDNDGILTWESLPVNYGYYVSINGFSKSAWNGYNVNERIEELLERGFIKNTGTYEIVLKAKDYDSGEVVQSWSTEYEYDSETTGPIFTEVELNEEDEEVCLNWEWCIGVNYADFFKIYIDDIFIENYDDTFLELNALINRAVARGWIENTGDHIIKLEAYTQYYDDELYERKSVPFASYEMSYYYISNAEGPADDFDEEMVPMGDRGDIMWRPIKGANCYKRYINDVLCEDDQDNEFSFEFNTAIDRMIYDGFITKSDTGTYDLRLEALASDEEGLEPLAVWRYDGHKYDSEWELGPDQFVFTNFDEETGLLEWKKVRGNVYYTVSLGDDETNIGAPLSIDTYCSDFNTYDYIDNMIAYGHVEKQSQYDILFKAWHRTDDGDEVFCQDIYPVHYDSIIPEPADELNYMYIDRAKGGHLIWNKVNGANYYHITIDGDEEGLQTSQLSIYLDDLIMEWTEEGRIPNQAEHVITLEAYKYNDEGDAERIGDKRTSQYIFKVPVELKLSIIDGILTATYSDGTELSGVDEYMISVNDMSRDDYDDKVLPLNINDYIDFFVKYLYESGKPAKYQIRVEAYDSDKKMIGYADTDYLYDSECEYEGDIGEDGFSAALEMGQLSWMKKALADHYDIKVKDMEDHEAVIQVGKDTTKMNIFLELDKLIKKGEITPTDRYKVSIIPVKADGTPFWDEQDVCMEIGYITKAEAGAEEFSFTSYDQYGTLKWEEINGASFYTVILGKDTTLIKDPSLSTHEYIDRLIENGDIPKQDEYELLFRAFHSRYTGPELVCEGTYTITYDSDAHEPASILNYTDIDAANNGLMTWNKVNDAGYYQYTIDGKSGTTTDRSVSLDDIITDWTEQGLIEDKPEHSIILEAYQEAGSSSSASSSSKGIFAKKTNTVMAKAPDGGDVRIGEPVELVYTFKTPGKLKLDISDEILTATREDGNELSDAKSFTVVVNGVSRQNNGLPLNINDYIDSLIMANGNFKADTYSVRVYAYDELGKEIGHAGMFYEYYSETEYTPLNEVELNRNGDLISWDPVDGADHYDVYIGYTGEYVSCDSDTTEFNVADFIDSKVDEGWFEEEQETGLYPINVYAVDSKTNYITKGKLEFEYTSEVEPATYLFVSLSNEGAISWEAVSGASYYEVGVGDSYSVKVDGTTANINDILNEAIENGYQASNDKYNISVKAIGSDGRILSGWTKAKYEYKQNEEPLHEHSWGEAVRENEVPATCTTAGSYEEVVYCTVCKIELSRETKTVAALGHKLPLTHHEAKAATTEAAGNSEYWSCDRCGKFFSDAEGKTEIQKDSWVIPALKPADQTPSDKPVDNDPSGSDSGKTNPEGNAPADDKTPADNNPSDTTPAPTDNTEPEPEDTLDPAKEMGKDGTAVGEGASAEAAEAAITAAKTDKDIKGSVYNKIQLKQSKVTKNSITVAWSKVKNAKKYVIYANKSGKSNKFLKITTVTKTKYTLKKIKNKVLAKGTYYKFMVVALNSKGKVLTSSKAVHIATSGKTVASNPGKITTKAKKDKVTIKAKKTFKLAGAYAASSKKLKIKKVLGMRYESTNTKVATVSSKGVIKGVKKGTCYVYAYAQNGLAKKIKVTVK